MSIRDEYIQARIAEIHGRSARSISKQINREIRAEARERKVIIPNQKIRKYKCTGIWRKQ